MKLQQKGVLLLGFVAVLSACGNTTQSANVTNLDQSDNQVSEDVFIQPVPAAENKPDDRRERTESLTPAMQAARDGKIYCSSRGNCNPSVVMISSATEAGVARCSGILIAEDLVLTNDHCINKSDAIKRKRSCDQQLYVHFLSLNGGPSQSVSCAQVVFQSKESGLFSKDYAIIKLKGKVKDRAPVRLSERGFERHESTTMVKIQMTTGANGSLDGIQESVNCYSSYQTMLYPAVANSNSPLMTFGGCPVVSGNSGSALLNADGELGAVAQGYINLKSQPQITAQLLELGIEPLTESLTLGTQVRCMDYLKTSVTSKCGEVAPGTGLMPRDYLNQYSGVFAERMVLPYTALQWKKLAGYTSLQVNYVESPPCFNARELSNPQGLALPVLQYRASINQTFEIAWKAYSAAPRAMFTVQSLYSGEAHLTSALGTVTVPLCTR